MRLRTLAVLAAAGLALAGCGTTEKPGAAEPSATGGPVSVTDSRGKQIKLERPASRVVALEWGEAEMLATLGVMPVGVADTKGYATWVTAAKLDPSVADVGTRGEPSVDAIVKLQPDLVVMEDESKSPVVAQLEKYVPVIVTKGSDATRNLDRLRDDFRLLAAATGTSAAADRELAAMDAAFDGVKGKLAAAGHAGKPFAMADGWKEGSTISIRMFGRGALVSDVATRVGLANTWTGKVDALWGLGTTDVEGLTPLKTRDLHFLYNASAGDDVFAAGLSTNAIWRSMTFVQKGQVRKLTPGIWTFGGPASCRQYAAELVKVFGA
ncbi:ABC transporter substrate-binding protein [Pilimelia anulata]|uniref:ABC transporter substrate-binding protein n=2 Tax=Pilimelia anulata TaxID=53371 RepID=A0A8J3B7C4_9ACTN|nr:ABC transporter substrate-binding protein [Pilimelia anulata]